MLEPAPIKKELSLQLMGRPITVRATDDEAIVLRKAAGLVEQKLTDYRKNYGIRDEVYLLLMVLLDLGTELAERDATPSPQPHAQPEHAPEVDTAALQAMNQLLTEALAHLGPAPTPTNERTSA